MSDKPRVIKNYDRLDDELLEQIKLFYPKGFERNLIRFTDVNGKIASALPFETEEKFYLIRMTKSEAQTIVEDDDDYNDDGILTDEAREEYEDKYDELDLEEVMDEEGEQDEDDD